MISCVDGPWFASKDQASPSVPTGCGGPAPCRSELAREPLPAWSGSREAIADRVRFYGERSDVRCAFTQPKRASLDGE